MIKKTEQEETKIMFLPALFFVYQHVEYMRNLSCLFISLPLICLSLPQVKDLSGDERATIDKMVERLEDFDDVQNVYTNMKPEEEAE